ncbi:AAA family ATPase [Streptomyces regalis]|uniref:Nuclease SbcCD subunit C n=1 Tax=Streptomyces regalis TaxID=68262 RepID=A0A101JIF3_9ACTN|nr:SMC family ATPase [Streptomyces regalis]KUL27347.1 recombination protein RecF [Streptomyces regalis]
MKPLTLSIIGLRSYPTPVTVDFTGKSLVAALGNTGAGKSSMLDAIVFALFRKSSWDAKEPRQLIADGAQAMSVELTFLHNGQRWHIHRTMHATNPNAARHHLKNLDTGEEIDGANDVDPRIKAILQMGYDTFLRVGLLPQGKFDRLLVAAPKERSARLRELFGAESLESVQQMAARRREALKDLLVDARAKRDSMPADPERAAEEAGAAADAAEARAERLSTAVDRITGLQKEISEARTAAEKAAAARTTLSARTVTGAGTSLDALEAVAADIAARRDALDDRDAQARAQESELTDEITAAEAEGEGPSALTKAAVILQTLAEHATEHRSERDRLAELTGQLAGEREDIATTEADLAERVAHTKPLAEAARAASQASREIRIRAATARTALTAALSTARRVADTASAEATAVSEHRSARDGLGPLETATAAADKALAAAERHLEAHRLRNRAAAIAAELQPGDDCLVCHRQLPADFAPGSTTDTAELTTAKTQLDEAKTAREAAADRLAEARATVTEAEKTVLAREKDHRDTQQKARKAIAEAVSAFEDLEALAAGTGRGFEAESASATLTAATTALATPTTDGAAQPQERPEQNTAPITDAIAACEQTADDHAENLKTEEHRLTARIEAEHTTLEGRKEAHRRAVDDAATASKRHARAAARTTADLHALPTRIRAILPDEAIDVTADEASAAAAAVTIRQAETQELLDRREEARAEKTSVLAQQRALDQEARTDLERPLNELRGNLDAWAHAATQAVAHLDDASNHRMPQAPTEPGIAEVRQFVVELSAVTQMLDDQLTERATTATERANTAATSLGEHAAALCDVEDFASAADLTAPSALHPLVTAAAHANRETEEQLQKQQKALDTIKPAADLDFAIAAGKARYEALEVLRTELVDAKFLGHLTTLRTHALLGVASDLLQHMTEGRFGFADTFDIVSRSSGVNHHPNRLSGGEKFLASLALALALAELHSRNGSSLGSLFLDEGFAALDTTTLDSALDVLRAQAGGNRLVMVISHLHAVAEAVDDVLWVERTPAGSSAHWLTSAERDDLVQADLASGLQELAR